MAALLVVLTQVETEHLLPMLVTAVAEAEAVLELVVTAETVPLPAAAAAQVEHRLEPLQ